jgi:hypothetical protein
VGFGLAGVVALADQAATLDSHPGTSVGPETLWREWAIAGLHPTRGGLARSPSPATPDVLSSSSLHDTCEDPGGDDCPTQSGQAMVQIVSEKRLFDAPIH